MLCLEMKYVKSIKENIKENSLSTDSGDLFDFDDAWKKTFSIYPKKTAYSTSKTAWMDKVLEVIEENQPDIARLLYKATEAYLSDYQEKNPDDKDFRYIPKYVDWLKNDCDYWLQIVEKRGDCSWQKQSSEWSGAYWLTMMC